MRSIVNVISPRTHGVLDYLTVLVFAVSPSLLGLSPLPSKVAWAIAGSHLGFTLFTRYPLGLLRIVPMKLHGWVELVAGPAISSIPWVLGFATEAAARTFFLTTGFIVFAVWIMTDYGAPQEAPRPA